MVRANGHSMYGEEKLNLESAEVSSHVQDPGRWN